MDTCSLFNDKAELSRYLLWVLDCLGYGEEQRTKRKEVYKNLDERLTTDVNYMLRFITVGSKGEGLTNVYEKDKDLLVIESTGICVEEGSKLEDEKSKNKNIFTLDTQHSSPGHGLLIASKAVDMIGHLLGNATIYMDDERVLSSKQFKAEVNTFVRNSVVIGNGTKIHDKSGPAARIENGLRREDHVYALECHCPVLLSQWATRERPGKWPTEKTKFEVLKLSGYVVATGCKESECKEHEWRICFNTGERLLIDSLNNVQTKLYVLLKIIVSDIIRPDPHQLTSFMIKNIVFWLAELYPQDLFTDESLVTWLFGALRMLKQSLKMNMLPYFMITDRNVFAGKFDSEQRRQLLRKVAGIVKKGPKVLLKSKRLHKIMLFGQLNPLQLEEVACYRNKSEILYLKASHLSDKSTISFTIGPSKRMDPEPSCEEERMYREIADLISPGWRRDAENGRFNIQILIRDLSEILT